MKRLLLLLLAATFLGALPAAAQVQEIAFDSAANALTLPDDIYLGEVAGVATNSKGDIFVYTRTGHPTLTIGAARGFVHGGLISALADNAMGLSCRRTLAADGALVTVSLVLDFLASAFKGQWLEFDTVFVKPGSTLCFAQAFVTADGTPCARASAVFRVLTSRAARSA